MTEPVANPILTSPYEPPQRYLEIGPHGPTGEVKPGRRPSESYVPIPPARRGKKLAAQATQTALDFDLTGERRERNSLINELRQDVELWRQRSYHGTTA